MSVPLAPALRAIELPPLPKSKDSVDLNWARDEAVAKAINLFQYLSVMAGYVEHHDKAAAAKLRALARVLA